MEPKETAKTAASEVIPENAHNRSDTAGAKAIPWRIKILAVILVSLIGFGSHWSSGLTGAMKSTIKKVCCVITENSTFANR